MKRILCIVSSMDVGGAETFLMKLYRNLNKEKYQMDFCVNTTDKGFYDDEILAMGGKIFVRPKKIDGIRAAFSSIEEIVRKNNYMYVLKIVQHSLGAIDLIAARKGGAKYLALRTSNADSSTNIKKILHQMFKPIASIVPNIKIAPSEKAAMYTFGKKAYKNGEIKLLKNGIELKSFAYSKNGSEKIRAELGLKDEFIVGHIGRFANQKNHKRLLEIFKEIKEKKADAQLVLVGKGELEDNIKIYARELGIIDSVHFMGIRTDIQQILSSMDVFVFPSFYEGMPNTMIEAQANGVPCVMSDSVTGEAKLTDNLIALSLSNNNEIWAETAINLKRIDSEINAQKLHEAGYSIKGVVEQFVNEIFEKY